MWQEYAVLGCLIVAVLANHVSALQRALTAALIGPILTSLGIVAAMAAISFTRIGGSFNYAWIVVYAGLTVAWFWGFWRSTNYDGTWKV